MITNCQNDIFVLKDVFFKIFSNNDPFGKMFVPSILHKIILYPTNGYYLSKKQFLALTYAVQISGETSYYLSEIEGQAFIKNDTHSIHPSEHLQLSISCSYDEYEKKTIIFENAFYSSSGNWGVIISHEGHAVLGGCEKFITTFKKLYPDWRDDQKKFLEAVEYWGKLAKTDLSWVPDFIKYING